MKRFDKKQNMDEITFSLESVVELLEVSTSTVKNWVDTGELQSIHSGPDGKLRFGIEEVVDLMLIQEKRKLGIK